jgi:putative ABC transport system permease protein
MENVFREQRERGNGSGLWWKTAIGFLRTAPAEHADVFRRDIRHGLRSLAKNPVITLIAIAVLAIGIGASTAIFSAVNMMLIRPLPVPNPEQVIRVTVGSRIGSVDYTQYVEYRDRNHTMSQLAAFQDKQVTLRTDGPPESAVATAVSGNCFAALEAPPLLGRVIAETDDRPGAPGVVMLSEDFWRHRFNADTAAVGRTVRINGSSLQS